MKKILISVATFAIASSVFASNSIQSMQFPQTVSYQQSSMVVPEGKSQVISVENLNLQSLRLNDGAILKFTNKYPSYWVNVDFLLTDGSGTINVPKNVHVTLLYQNASPGVNIKFSGQGSVTVQKDTNGY